MVPRELGGEEGRLGGAGAGERCEPRSRRVKTTAWLSPPPPSPAGPHGSGWPVGVSPSSSPAGGAP